MHIVLLTFSCIKDFVVIVVAPNSQIINIVSFIFELES